MTDKDFQQANRFKNWPTWLTLAITIMIVVAPLIYSNFAHERERWQLAIASEKRLDAGVESGIAVLDDAIKRNPESPKLLYLRCQLHSQLGALSGPSESKHDRAALQDLEKQMELLNTKQSKGLESDLLKKTVNRSEWKRAELLIRLERLPEARTLLQELQRKHSAELEYAPPALRTLSGKERIRFFTANEERNKFSYHCSQAIHNLDDALRYSNITVKNLRPENLEIQNIIQVYFILEENEAALELLNVAIETIEKDYKTSLKELSQQATHAIALGVPIDQREMKSLSPVMMKFQNISDNYCSFLSHRAAIYRRQEKINEAEADELRCKEIGKKKELKTDERTKLINSFQVKKALVELSISYQYIDTRGAVYYRLRKYNKALADFDRAIRTCRLLNCPALHENTKEELGQSTDPRETALHKQYLKQALAKLLYHRALTKRALEDVSGAEKDESEIIELGLTPSRKLF